MTVAQSADVQNLRDTVLQLHPVEQLAVLAQLAIDGGDQLDVLVRQLVGTAEHTVVVLRNERQSSVHEVAEVVQQFAVHLQLQIGPREARVLRFWSHVEQVEPVDVGRQVGALRIVTEHADISALRELRVLVVQVVDAAQMSAHRVPFAGAQLHGRKDDRMERYVVFRHELVELHLVRVLPPFLPFVGQVGRDR